MPPWWMPIAASLSGVALGFVLANVRDWWSRRRRRKAHWSALGAELEFCRHHAEVYSRDYIAAPLYRLPTVAYRHSLPALLAEGAVNEGDLDPLMVYFNEVETLNRGLDLAQSARDKDDETLQAEVKRNRLKAERLRSSSDAGTNYYAEARAAVDRNL